MDPYISTPVTMEERKTLFGHKYVVECTVCESQDYFRGQEEADEEYLNHMVEHPHWHVSLAEDNKKGFLEEDAPIGYYGEAVQVVKQWAKEHRGVQVVYDRGVERTTGMGIYQIQKKQGKVVMLITAFGCLGNCGV